MRTRKCINLDLIAIFLASGCLFLAAGPSFAQSQLLNVPQFCRTNILNGILPQLTHKVESLRDLKPDSPDLEDRLTHRMGDEPPWNKTFLPLRRLRRSAITQNESIWGLIGTGLYYGSHSLDYQTPLENIEQALKRGFVGRKVNSVKRMKDIEQDIKNGIPTYHVARTSNSQYYYLNELALLRPFQGDEYNSQSSTWIEFTLCSELVPLHFYDCTKAFSLGVELGRPFQDDPYGEGKVDSGSPIFSFVPLTIKILSDASYVDGARRAALKMIEHVREGSVGSNVNLFNDLYNSYRESGQDHALAEQSTWDILGLVSTGGGNIGLRLNMIPLDPQFDELKLALIVIGATPPYLDSLTIESGSPYSLPSKVKTTCDLGKNYHFWLTAYLAREMAKLTNDTTASAAAAFILQKGYEIMSRTAGRDPVRAFTVDAFDPVNNVMRMDLAYSSAGAVYGAQSIRGKSPNLNIDEGLDLLIHSAKVLPPLSKIESEKLWRRNFGISAYRRWQSLFAPDLAFNFQLAQSKK